METLLELKTRQNHGHVQHSHIAQVRYSKKKSSTHTLRREVKYHLDRVELRWPLRCVVRRTYSASSHCRTHYCRTQSLPLSIPIHLMNIVHACGRISEPRHLAVRQYACFRKQAGKPNEMPKRRRVPVASVLLGRTHFRPFLSFLWTAFDFKAA